MYSACSNHTNHYKKGIQNPKTSDTQADVTNQIRLLSVCYSLKLQDLTAARNKIFTHNTVRGYFFRRKVQNLSRTYDRTGCTKDLRIQQLVQKKI